MPMISYFSFFAAGIVYYLIYAKGLTLNRVIILILCFSMTALIHGVSGLMNLFFGTTTRMFITLFYHLLFVLVVSGKAPLLASKPFRFFGLISYPLYLIHQSIGFCYYYYLLNYTNKYIAIFGGISISILVATLVTYGFEQPIQKWRKSFRTGELLPDRKYM